MHRIRRFAQNSRNVDRTGWLATLAVLLLLCVPQSLRAMPMPGDGAPRDAGVEDNTGANRLVVPVPVPPGTGGFVPALALRYASDAGDGPFGFGWKLELGEIRRSFRFGTPSFDDATDAFELGSELLVANAGESRPGRTRYHTLTEGFSRVLHLSGSGEDRWEVTRPDGTILRFGSDTSSRVLRDGTQGPIARWLLREMQDTHGNTIRFEHWIEDGADYPLRVQYTLRDGAPVGRLHTIEFHYAERPDPSVTFMSGVRREIRRRASEIVVLSGSDVFRRLELTYADARPEGKRYRTGRSRLAAIQMLGVGGREALPAQRFEYADPNDDTQRAKPRGGFASSGFSLPDGVSLGLDVPPSDVDGDGRTPETSPLRFGDVDGDGRVDLLRAVETASGKLTQQVFLNEPDGFVLSPAWSQALALDAAYLAQSGRALRVQIQTPAPRDGCFVTAAAVEPDANPVLFASPRSAENLVEVPGEPDLRQITFPATWEVADVDGDGRADLLSSYRLADVLDCDAKVLAAGERVAEVWLNTGAGWQRDAERSQGLPEFATGAVFPSTDSTIARHRLDFIELDGDGLTDFALERLESEASAKSRAVHFFRQQRGSGWQEAPEYGVVPEEPLFADLNEDGLTDLIASNRTDRAQLNTGSGWCDPLESAATACPSATRFRLPVPMSARVQLADLSGDGLIDVAERAADPNKPGRAWIHDPSAPGGSVFVEDPQFALPPGNGGLTSAGLLPKQPFLLDADADGALDVLNREAGKSFRGTVRFSDRLTRFENGQGGTIAYAYESTAVQPALLERLADAFTSLPPEGVPRGSTQPVLSARSVTGVDLVPFTELLAYARPRFVADLRMSLGFALVQRSVAGASTRNAFFAQQIGVSGRLVRSETLDPQTSALVAQEDRRFEVLAGDDPAVGAGSTADARVGRLVERRSSLMYGVANAETAGATVSETFEYGTANRGSGFGFVTRRTSARASGTLVSTRTPVAPDLDRWIVQLVAEMRSSDGAGRELARTAFDYDEAGDATAITAFEGARGDLDRASPRTTRRIFDAFGNLRALTDPAGRTTEFCSDGDARFPSGAACGSSVGSTEGTHSVITATLDPLGGVTAQTPDPITGQIREVARTYSGDADRQRFDAFGRVTETTFQPTSGSEISLGEIHYFDAENSPTGQPFAESFARTTQGGAEAVRQATYLDGLGRPVRTVSEAAPERGAKRFFGTTTRSNPAARETTTTFPAACGAGGTDPHCANLLGGSQPRTIERRDALGRPVEITTPDGVTRFAYQPLTRMHPDTGMARFDAVEALDARGALTRRLFDGDRLVWVDECKNDPQSARGKDPAKLACESPAVTFYRYEASGEVAEIHDARSPEPGRATVPALRTVFDSLGRVVQTFDANKDAATAITYDDAGDIVSQTNARGQTVEFVRDPLGRPTEVRVPTETGGIRSYRVDYDPRTRQPARIEQSQGAASGSPLSLQTFGYDALGRQNRETLQIGASAALVTDVDLDLLGRTTRIRTPDRGTTLGYSYEGAVLRQVCELGTGARCTQAPQFPYLSNVEYDPIGREIALVGTPLQTGAAPRFALSYDPRTYRLEHLELTPTAGPSAEHLDLAYTYDPAGNVLSIDDRSPQSGANDVAQSIAYEYDARNRLSQRTRGRDTAHFTYDDLGNLIGKNVAAAGERNQTFDPEHPNRVLDAQGTAFAYDADGNVTRRGTQTLRFDALGRLDCLGTGTCTDSFVYGLSGERLAALTNGTPTRIFTGDTFEWEPATGAATVRVFALGRQIAFKRIAHAELRSASASAEAFIVPLQRGAPWALGALAVLGAASLLALALQGGFTTAIRLRPATACLATALAALLIAPHGVWAASLPTDRGTYRRFVWEDRLGSALNITDEQGKVVAQRAFEPFGEIAAETSSEPTERTFAGQRFEDASGLYFFKARWYDPAAGRFLSVDPMVRSLAVPQSINGYSYVENDPTNRVDPTGLVTEPISNFLIRTDPDDDPSGPIDDPTIFLPPGPPIVPPGGPILDPDAPFTATAASPAFTASAGGSLRFLDSNQSESQGVPGAEDAIEPALLGPELLIGPLVGLGRGLFFGISRAFAREAIAEVASASPSGLSAAANFAQRTFSERFSDIGQKELSKIAGTSIRTISDLVSALRNGLDPSKIPVNVIVRDGNTLILNTRTVQALERAGVPRGAFNVITKTGEELFEALLTNQLTRNGLTSSGISSVIPK